MVFRFLQTFHIFVFRMHFVMLIFFYSSVYFIYIIYTRTVVLSYCRTVVLSFGSIWRLNSIQRFSSMRRLNSIRQFQSIRHHAAARRRCGARRTRVRLSTIVLCSKLRNLVESSNWVVSSHRIKSLKWTQFYIQNYKIYNKYKTWIMEII